MVKEKIAKKDSDKVDIEKNKTSNSKKLSVKKAKKIEKYFYAVGRRKTAVAQVRLFPGDKSKDSDLIVNNRKMKEYFLRDDLQAIFNDSLKEVGVQDKFKVSVLVKGGGITGQAEAIRLGIARALIKFDINLRAVLKAKGFLTRDARKVERKKPGLKKARRAPQWSKR